MEDDAGRSTHSLSSTKRRLPSVTHNDLFSRRVSSNPAQSQLEFNHTTRELWRRGQEEPFTSLDTSSHSNNTLPARRRRQQRANSEALPLVTTSNRKASSVAEYLASQQHHQPGSVAIEDSRANKKHASRTPTRAGRGRLSSSHVPHATDVHMQLHDPFNVRSHTIDASWRKEWHTQVLRRFRDGVEMELPGMSSADKSTDTQRSNKFRGSEGLFDMGDAEKDPFSFSLTQARGNAPHHTPLNSMSGVGDVVKERVKYQRERVKQRFKDTRALADIVRVELKKMAPETMAAPMHQSSSSLMFEPEPTYEDVKNWTKDIVDEVVACQQHDSDSTRLRGCKLCTGVKRSVIVYPPPPPAVVDGLIACLNDREFDVKFWAALSLAVFETKAHDQACAILRHTLKHGSESDRWLAARCLASLEVASADVLAVLFDAFCGADDLSINEARDRIVHLATEHSEVMHFVVDMLHSEHSHHRAEAVRLLPIIQPYLSSSQVASLIDMLWSDSAQTVRDECYASLISVNHTTAVYDSIELRLTSNKDQIRVDALQKLGFIGHTPRRLFSLFLATFSDPFSNVRSAAVCATASFQPPPPAVVDKVMERLSSDESSKVRADAINTLRSLGLHTPKVHALIAWTLRYEAQPVVLKAACEFLHDMHDSDVAQDELRQAVLWRVHTEGEAELKALVVACKERKQWTSNDAVAQEHRNAVKRAIKRLSTKESILKGIQQAPLDPLGLRELFAAPTERK